MGRQITYHFNEDDFASVIKNTSRDEVDKALSYLTTWAMSGYDICEIDMHRDEIVGIYRQSKGPSIYEIHAIWHEGHFGFHS